MSPVFEVSPADVVYYFAPMVLALLGGMRAYAPGQHFPLASQVQGTLLSFKILPTVLETLVRPFGHPFKVTPKGGGSQGSSYSAGIFWIAAGLITVTILGLLVNSVPDWRIIETGEALPIVAFWSAINIIVLFFVCMMALQAPVRRTEQRFDLDEEIWVVGPGGMISSGRIKDLSISGVALLAGAERALSARNGDSVRVFITEVGFVAGTVVRQTGNFLGVKFTLPPSIERDLLIRKLFTSGIDGTNVISSGATATTAMLKSIWGARTEMIVGDVEDEPRSSASLVKLPAQSLVVLPRPMPADFSELVEQRRAMVA